MMKKLLAAAALTLGCATSHAALVRIDVTATVTYSYKYVTKSIVLQDGEKDGTTVSASMIFNTDSRATWRLDGLDGSFSSLSSVSGCPVIYQGVCQDVEDAEATILESAAFTVGSTTYGALNLPRVHKMENLSKYWSIPTTSGFNAFQEQSQRELLGVERYRLIDLHGSESAGLASWFGNHPVELAEEHQLSDFGGMDLVLDLKNFYTDCNSPGVCYLAGEDSFGLSARVTSLSVSLVDENSGNVPEPGTLALVCAGLVGLVAGAKKRKQLN